MISGRRKGAQAIPSVERELEGLLIKLPSNDYRDAIVGFESEMTLSPLSPCVWSRWRCARIFFAQTYPRRARVCWQQAPMQGLILNELHML
jgi:hypothetical protein